MEFLAEILAFIVIEIILSAIGWFCLLVWYRNRKKMEEIKNKKYAGEYSNVAKIMILNLIAGVGAVTLFGVVIFVLVAWVYKSITHENIL